LPLPKQFKSCFGKVDFNKSDELNTSAEGFSPKIVGMKLEIMVYKKTPYPQDF